MIKILFLIHDLGPGGAEKVLVNLANNLNPSKFDITVMALFGGGVNEQFLKPHIRYISCFKKMVRGNSHLMKLMSPQTLHKLLIKDEYDIEVSYLEGPSTRIISGCPDKKTKLISWVHCKMTPESFAIGYRSLQEAKNCYNCFDKVICVSNTVQEAFCNIFSSPVDISVLYNTNESKLIQQMSKEEVSGAFNGNEINLIGVGKVIPVKGFARLAHIHVKLRQNGYPVHTYILGSGSQQTEIEEYIKNQNLSDSFTFLGYQTNPYKYIAKSNLFVCSSYSEGFSTAATEALIVGTPVCTVDVSGMKEMLGENNEYGIVTENNEDALHRGIKRLLDEPDLLAQYKKRAKERGQKFSTQETVNAVERMFLRLREQ